MQTITNQNQAYPDGIKALIAELEAIPFGQAVEVFQERVKITAQLRAVIGGAEG